MTSLSPKISHVSEKEAILSFRISGVDVSIANAIRRTILTDIPVQGFTADTINITKNNCVKMHDQVLQLRMENIPILLDSITPSDTYELILDITNTTDTLREVHTGDFQVINLQTQKNESDLLSIWFPKPFPLLQLQGRISESIMGETIQLRCRPQLVTARQHAAFVAGNVGFAWTPNPEKITQEVSKIEEQYKKEGLNSYEIASKIQNWKLLEGARHTLDNTFDFMVESYCFYSPTQLVVTACSLLSKNLRDFIISLNQDRYSILENQSMTIPNAWDIQLSQMDESLANILTHFLYTKYFLEDKKLSFCACARLHPYDEHLTLRVACVHELDTATHLKEKMEICAQLGIRTLEELEKGF
jgi:DNA-directed RNA polymerase subunit L